MMYADVVDFLAKLFPAGAPPLDMIRRLYAAYGVEPEVCPCPRCTARGVYAAWW
jgi:hypothetical protein